jgi:hypothetical protein
MGGVECVHLYERLFSVFLSISSDQVMGKVFGFLAVGLLY